MELKNYGMIEYNILRRADTKFVTDDKMVMTIEDNLIYRERSGSRTGTGKDLHGALRACG